MKPNGLKALKAFCALWALGLAFAGGAAASQPLSRDTVQAIDAAMNNAVATGWTAGGAVAVMRHGKIVFSRAYGFANLETGTPATTDTVFRIGSLTKQFTATAVLLLAEDGKLSIDDPVAKYLPQFPENDSTTIRQLLTHTSGIHDYIGAEGFFDQKQWLPLTTDELVAYVLSHSPLHDFPPGAQWAYSSSNYALAGAIIEKVSGQRLRTFLKMRIFDPLGMTQTALDDGRDIVPHRASGYDRIAENSPGYETARTISMTVPFAAGAVRSTVGDLLLWSDALMHGRVLKPESCRQMTTPVRLNDGSLPTQSGPDGEKGL